MSLPALTRRSLPALAAGLLALAAACSSDGTGPGGGPLPGETAARYRVVNGSPYALTVLRDGAIVARDIPSGEFTALLGLPAEGPVALQLRRGGGAADVAVSFTAQRDVLTTVAATAAAGQPLTARVLGQASGAPVAARGKLRLVHLAAEAPAVDLWYTPPGGGLPTRATPAPFPLGAESAYLETIPGTWRVWATPAGQTAPVVAEANAVLVGSGAVRTVALLPTGNGVTLRVFDDR